MRIAVITPYLVGKAGGERLALDLAGHLGELGNSVEIFCYAADPETCYTEMMAKVKINTVVGMKGSAHGAIHSRKGFFKRHFGFARPYYEFFMMRKLGHSIPKGFDVVLCLNQPSHWAAYFAKRRLSIPVVWICNEPPFYHDERIEKGALGTISGLPIYKVWDVRAARAVDKVIALSRLYKKYIDRVYGVESRVEYIGMDPPSIAPSMEIRDKFGLPKGMFAALFVGTFTDYKRPLDAIKAASMVDGVALFMVGEGESDAECRALARDLGTFRSVFFVSRVQESELEAFYSQCDCLIFTAEQSWGLVVPEAMIRGRPVITCPETGASEIIEDGETGFVVAGRNPEAIAEKLALLKADPGLAAKLGEKAREWVLANLSQEEYARRVERDLADAAGKGK